MFCPKCGTENPDDARFCGSCGAALDAPAPAAPRSEPEVLRLIEPGAPVAEVSPGLKWGVLAGSVVVPFVGIGMGLYFWIKGESEERKTVGRLWFFVALALAVLYSLLANEGY